MVGISLLSLKWLATGKTGMEIVPVVDTLLAQIPAEVDFLTVAQAEEVGQAHSGVCQFAAKCVQLGSQALQGAYLPGDLLLQPGHAPVQVVSVAHCLHPQLIQFLFSALQSLPALLNVAQ